MATDSDVLILGGGLNGPVLALALASAGITSTLVDARPGAERGRADFDGRAYALSLTSRRMLGALGLWDALGPFAQAIEDIKVSDGRAGEGASPWFMHFDHREIDEGPMGHFLEDRYLRGALADAVAAEPRIRAMDGARVTDSRGGAVRAEAVLAGGKTLRGRVLVGCDGRESAVAARAGITRAGWDYGQTALVCAVAHARSHGATAHQFFMPQGPLAILPLPGNRSSIVWTETHARARAIAAMDAAAYLSVLRPRFGDFLGEIALEGARYSYPLGLSLAMRLTGPRTVLVGDAAHGIHPLAGQGLNLGLRDVAALAEVMATAHRRGQDIGAVDVLADYARWRRADIAALALATDGLNRIFSNDNPVMRFGRDLGLRLAGGMPGLRRTFSREAAGLSGDLPALLRGEPI